MKDLADRPLRVAGEVAVLHWWRTLRWLAEVRLVPQWREGFHHPLTAPLRVFLVDGLTHTGKVLLFLCVMVMLLGFRRGESYLLSSAGAAAGLLLWCKLLGWWYRPVVRVTRVSPEHAVAGQEYRSHIRIENTGTRALKNFALREMRVPGNRRFREWKLGYRETLSSGDSTTVPVMVTPQSRGSLPLRGVSVQSYFPFFLTRSCRKLPLAKQIPVLPAPFPHAVPSLRQLGEAASSASKFGTDSGGRERALDYTHSRPFQAGDPPTRIDQRASARFGNPMSKIYEGAEKIKPQGVAIACDTSLADFFPWQPKPLQPELLDLRLSLVVELVHRARGEELPLAAVSWGGESFREIDNLESFYREVASCPASRVAGLPESQPNPAWIYLLVLGRWLPHYEQSVRNWRAQGRVVLVFLLPERDQDQGTLPTEVGFYEVGR